MNYVFTIYRYLYPAYSILKKHIIYIKQRQLRKDVMEVHMEGFTSGYYFFETAPENTLKMYGRIPSGFITIRDSYSPKENTVKIHCTVENIPASTGNTCKLFFSSLTGLSDHICDIQLQSGRGENDIYIEKDKLSGFDAACIITSDMPQIIIMQIFTGTPRTLDIKNFIPVEQKPVFKEDPKPESPTQPIKEEVQTKNETDRHGKKSLKEIFNLNFKPYDPFNTTSHSYKWWIPDSFKQAREILSEVDIQIPINIINGLYEGIGRCGHMLVGLYTDAISGRNFVITGVPSVKPESEAESGQNEAKAARWVPCSNQITDANFAGYWLYYIDSINSAIVKTVIK
jgi:hypothetical protein